MRKRSMLITLIICLLVSLSALVACGNTSKPKHSHKYIEVDEVASTCVTPGTRAHYKCEGCDKLFVKDGDKYVETTADELALPLAAHTFSGISVKTNPTKTVYTAFEEFELAGIEVVKTCSVAGCNGEAVNASDVTFAYAKEGADKLTADMTKVVIKAAGYETDLAVTVNKIVVDLPTIASKAYTGSALTADVAASELYTVTENNGGTDVGKYDVKLTLTDSVNYAFAGVEGAVATLEFEITKADNEITMPTAIADINCHGEPTIGATAKDGATISYVYSTAEDGEYGDKPEGGFVAGTYYVKAVAADTANLNGVTSSAMSFNVKHALHSWNTEDDKVDTGVCVCGAALADYTFNKVITDKRQDVLLESTENQLTLGGISEYKAVKSIKYGELSFGANKDALVIPEGINDVVHGEQYLTVVVTDNYDLDHTVQVPVTLITKSITTYDELVGCVTYKSERGTTGKEDKYNEGKYYILANSITVSGNYSASGINWADPGRGFAGTLDGRTKSIVGGNMWSGGLFGSIAGGTVKNIKFENINAGGTNRTLIAGTLYNATIENVEIYIVDKKVITGGAFFGVLSSHRVQNVTFNKVKIDATGSSLSVITGLQGNTDLTNVDNYHCTDVEIIADSVECLASGSNGKLYLDQVEGISYKLSGSVDTTKMTDVEAIDPKQFGDSSYLWSYTFAEPWTRYTKLKSATINGTDMGKSVRLMTNTFVVGDFSQFITEDMYNKTTTIVVEFEVKEGSSVKVALTVNVLDVNEQKTLTKSQDVILKDSTGEKTTFTLDLSEDADLAGATITGATFNEEKLTVEDGVITIPDSMKNGVHGSNVITVFATKGNTKYTITVPITIVTESIATITRLKEVVGYPQSGTGKTHEGEYFILADDITHSENYGAANNLGEGNGFAGTLDGRNHSLIGGNFYGGGLFGSIQDGTVKNIKFLQVNPVGENRTLIASTLYNATLENIEIKTYAVTVTKFTYSWGYFGVFASHRIKNVTMKDVSVDMSTSSIIWVFGSGWDNAATGNYHCENVVIKLKSLTYLAKSSNGDQPTLAKDAITGIKVTEVE